LAATGLVGVAVSALVTAAVAEPGLAAFVVGGSGTGGGRTGGGGFLLQLNEQVRMKASVAVIERGTVRLFFFILQTALSGREI
jgi:hypothetical protein